ncbi:MAG: hypothetical protein JWM11_938 [Planctomycetaceae bacterium]|nr:hypothetical protein [Planctomycetaceae bacterium]
MTSQLRSMFQQWWPQTPKILHATVPAHGIRTRRIVSTLLCIALPATVLPGCLSLAAKGLLPKKLFSSNYEDVDTSSPKLNTRSTSALTGSASASGSLRRVGRPYNPESEKNTQTIKQVVFKAPPRGAGENSAARGQNEGPNAFEADSSLPSNETGPTSDSTVTEAESAIAGVDEGGAGGGGVGGGAGSSGSGQGGAGPGGAGAPGTGATGAPPVAPGSKAAPTQNAAPQTAPGQSGAKRIDPAPGTNTPSKPKGDTNNFFPPSNESLPKTDGAKPAMDNDPAGKVNLKGDTSATKGDLTTDQDVPAAVPVPAIPQAGTATVGAPLQQITLQEAVTECESSFLLHAAAERMIQANADYTTSSLLPNPSVSGIASLQPFPGRPFVVSKTGGPPQYDLWTTYPFDWYLYGKRNAAMNAAAAGTQVASSEFQDFVRQRVIMTRLAFFDVLEAKELRDLAKQDYANLKQVEEITIKQIDLGGAGTVELDRVRLALYTSEREVGIREAAYKNFKSTLRMLMGRTEGSPDFDVAGSLKIDDPLQPVDIDTVLKTAQQVRPDIEAARKQVEWANAVLQQEQTKAKPQISGTLGFTYQQQVKALGVQDAPSYGGGLLLTLPIFDKNQGNITKAQSAYSQAYYNLQARLTSLQSEVEQATTAYRSAYQAATSINVGQESAATNVRAKIAAAYAAGGRPLIEVLDTERAFRDTMRLLINGRANYWKSLNQLNAVAGTNVLTP